MVQRNGAGDLRILWPGAPGGQASVHLGASPDTIDRTSPVARLVNGEAVISGLDADRRFYFELAPDDGSSPRMVAERLIAMEGAHNLRDLGGFVTADDRRVRWGRLYRSDHLAKISDRDLELLGDLGIRLVCDFRNAEEIEGDPDRLPEGVVSINPAIIVDGATPSIIEEAIVSGNEAGLDFSRILLDANEMLVREAAPQYRAFFRALEKPDNLPMLFHCTAGKDRAGFGAALVLLALGVPMDRVMDDYLATATYTADHVDGTVRLIRLVSLFRIEESEIRSLLGVRREFLQAAFDAIDEDYGTVDAYLREGLGVTDEAREELKTRLLR
jgi:protein-tyrosine phosphatase